MAYVHGFRLRQEVSRFEWRMHHPSSMLASLGSDPETKRALTAARRRGGIQFRVDCLQLALKFFKEYPLKVKILNGPTQLMRS
jgi:hypothetical protein